MTNGSRTSIFMILNASSESEPACDTDRRGVRRLAGLEHLSFNDKEFEAYDFNELMSYKSMDDFFEKNTLKLFDLPLNHTYRPALRAAATSSGGARAR